MPGRWSAPTTPLDAVMPSHHWTVRTKVCGAPPWAKWDRAAVHPRAGPAGHHRPPRRAKAGQLMGQGMARPWGAGPSLVARLVAGRGAQGAGSRGCDLQKCAVHLEIHHVPQESRTKLPTPGVRRPIKKE